MGAPSLREQVREALAVIEQLRAEIQALRAENERLIAENEALRDRVAHMAAEAKKDSSTSSKPPSTDLVEPRQSRAERRAQTRAAKRRQGKQPGAPERTFSGESPM